MVGSHFTRLLVNNTRLFFNVYIHIHIDVSQCLTWLVCVGSISIAQPTGDGGRVLTTVVEIIIIKKKKQTKSCSLNICPRELIR